MYQVGSSQGEVHSERQGTGLGTILPNTGREIEYAWKLGDGQKAAKDALRAKRDAALQKINAGNEYWYKHQEELGGRVNGLRQKGAELISGGINDPFVSQDPRAIEFRKEYDNVSALAKASRDLETAHKQYQTDLSLQKPEDFDDAAITRIDDFYNRKLEDIVKTASTAPPLMKKNPYMDAFDFVGKNMREWSGTMNGNVPDDTKTFDFVKALVNDPANKEKIVRTYGSKYAQLSPAEKADVDARSKRISIEPHVIMAFDDAKRWREQEKPFDPLAVFKTAASVVESSLNYSTYSDPNKSSTSYNKADMEQALDAATAAAFNSRQEWFDYYSDQIPRHEAENDGEYASRIQKKMKSDIRALVGTKTSFGITDKGGDKKDFDTQRNTWIEDVRSNDPVKSKAAAQWVVNSKVFGNLNIEDASIRMGPQGPVLNLTSKTNLSVDRVKEEMNGTMPGSVVNNSTFQDRQGVRIISIPIGQDQIANQWLAELYDTTYKIRGKQNYDGTISERTPNKVDDIGKKVVPLTTGPKANALFK